MHCYAKIFSKGDTCNNIYVYCVCTASTFQQDFYEILRQLALVINCSIAVLQYLIV